MAHLPARSEAAVLQGDGRQAAETGLQGMTKLMKHLECKCRWATSLLVVLLGAAPNLPAAAREQEPSQAERAPASLADVAMVDALVSRFAVLIGEGKIEAAFDTLEPYWTVPSSDVDALTVQLGGQRASLQERFGKPLGVELAGVQTLGSSFRRYLYFDKYERHAVVWSITLYRPDREWVVNTVRLTDQLDALYHWE